MVVENVLDRGLVNYRFLGMVNKGVNLVGNILVRGCVVIGEVGW